MKTKTHPIEQEELMAYLDGELPADRAAVAAAHLEQCSECQSFVTGMQDVSRKMMEWEVESFDAELSPDLPAGISEVKRRNWRDRFRVGGLAPWAAGFAACLVVGLGVRLIGTNANTASSQLGSAREEQIPAYKAREGKEISTYDGALSDGIDVAEYLVTASEGMPQRSAHFARLGSRIAVQACGQPVAARSMGRSSWAKK